MLTLIFCNFLEGKKSCEQEIARNGTVSQIFFHSILYEFNNCQFSYPESENELTLKDVLVLYKVFAIYSTALYLLFS